VCPPVFPKLGLLEVEVLMKKINLPFGGFQIHVPLSSIEESVQRLRKAIDEYEKLYDSIVQKTPNVHPVEVIGENLSAFEPELCEMKEAGAALQASLDACEFPWVLPRMTRELIFASVVAQLYGIAFEVIDYELKTSSGGRASWWAMGRAIDGKSRQYERPGTSFVFGESDEQASEGALLGACADAFVQSVFAAVPWFPKERGNVWIPMED
jgi:hypothetical protein